MSQHDMDVANATFPNTRTDINNALQALASTNSGTSRPTTAYANQLWLKTNYATDQVAVYLFDGTDDILLMVIDTTNNKLIYLSALITDQTAETVMDPAADYVLVYDASASALRKVLIQNLVPTSVRKEAIILAVTDQENVIEAGTGKLTFRMPYAFTLTEVRASLQTAQTSGSILTVDINEAGTTVLSTKLTVDNGEKTSTTAATAAVISDASLANDAEMTVDIDQIGDGTAVGLVVTLIGYPT